MNTKTFDMGKKLNPWKQNTWGKIKSFEHKLVIIV